MGDLNFGELLPRIVGFYFPFLFALCFHEYAHGWVAKKKGDNTAELMGRLTMNPVAHADPVGTVFLPLMAAAGFFPFLFGWAKPVPVDPRNLRNPKEDMFWIALAGPLSNLILAFIGTVVMVYLIHNSSSEGLIGGVQFFVIINLFLCFFNLIPLHPLDGGKILARFLPHSANQWLEDNQMVLNIILIASIFLGGFVIIQKPVEWAFKALLSLFI